ncbi:hypothetical protein ambt_05295 [Alteromonas naphthalenivorans]|uniref:Nucleotidyl transferase AbiEii toxin, Type IV TA system n=2 Tax=Alteromonas naphthalenivorans TaxID=715451 RepID=F5Z425_ALTNA|nr:hypothetical protein ambt_05295 [Alteromonas naphthalenivorans]
MQATEHEAMLMAVASMLDEGFLREITFVGGATVSLHLDNAQPIDISSTKDVDFIVSVAGYSGYDELSANLRGRGFKNYIPQGDENVPLCRFVCGDICVDVMPDDGQVLGFSNEWFKACQKHNIDYQLPNGVTIRIAETKYLLATKLVAFASRGEDMLSSKDAEDIVLLVNGKDSLVDEVVEGPEDLKIFIQDAMYKFIQNSDFEYVLSSNLQNEEVERQELILSKFNTLAGQE